MINESEIVAVDFPLSALPDDVLGGVFAFVCQYQEHASALTFCVAHALRLEARRRQNNRAGGEPIAPGPFGIDFSLWSDTDVAEALLTTHAWSTKSDHLAFAELADELNLAITTVAVFRLATSDDPRNPIPFDKRNHVDPETD